MRISGITIPEKKRLEVGLTAVYGVGRSRAQKILEETGISFNSRPHELSVNDENRIREKMSKFKVEGELKREVAGGIKRLKDIGCFRGIRHSKRLPVRGQRTRTNSRTIRGNVRKTMGSGKRRLEKT